MYSKLTLLCYMGMGWWREGKEELYMKMFYDRPIKLENTTRLQSYMH